MALTLSTTWYDALVDDSGGGTDGSVWDKAAVASFRADINAALATLNISIDDSGRLSLAASTELTIASDAITVTGNRHSVDTEADAASDNLATLTSGSNVEDGHVLILKPENASRVVTVKDGTGNMLLRGGDFAMNDAEHRLLLVRDGSNWYELARNTAGGGAGLSAGSNYINDSANAQMTVGLTINQGAADDEILTFKSSDVAHGMTTRTEDDTYGAFRKGTVAEGGIAFAGYSEGNAGFYLEGHIGSATTTKSTGGFGAVNILGLLKTGTTSGSLGANANIFAACDNVTVRFILDADGDSHQDVGTAWTNFDTEDDISVLNLLAAYVTRPDDPLRAQFGAWLERSRTTLERLRLVQFNPDGHHFVNMSRLTMLLVGAVRQVGGRLLALEDRVARLEAARG
jgi:hypothetical protein